jgi:hypothetical protein
MNEKTPQSGKPPQPLRLNLQCSLIVQSEEEAKDIYEEIGTFVKGISPTTIIGGNILKLLSPCCGEKKNDPIHT